MNILVGVTGSIAAYKAIDIVSALVKTEEHAIKVVMTKAASHFVNEMPLAVLSEHPVTTSLWDELDGKVNHIELAKWADMVVIVPATANIIAKLANGIADDVLSTICLALRPMTRRMIFPAMNTMMWRNPITQRNVGVVENFGWDIVQPGSGKLACGDVGEGKIPPTRTIVEHIHHAAEDVRDHNILRWPLPGIPYDSHPRGKFGVVRKFDRHTGIDLYAPEGQLVVAMEKGTVVARGPFTGPEVRCDDYPDGSKWWLPTEFIAVEGDHGIILYGEIHIYTGLGVYLNVGDKVQQGAHLGSVERVLRHDKGTPTSMLHVELLSEWTSRCPLVWERDAEEPPEILRDPTPLIQEARWMQ